MLRRSRIQLNGVPLHIVQRGHNREPCFFSEEDYTSYLHWLSEAQSDNECECQLHAYALMTHHVQLLLTPKKAEAVPKLIMSLGRRYVQYINRTYKRTGILWDSRYKSSVIQANTYLLTCQRYIELNPVRAAMVDDPAHYRWTSYRHNALGATDSRITLHALYQALGLTDKSRQSAYRGLFSAHLDGAAIDDIRQGCGRCLAYARPIAEMGWNPAALNAEIVCEVKKSVQNHRASACLTTPLSVNIVTNRKKRRLKFLYLPPRRFSAFPRMCGETQNRAGGKV